jgi:G3E family GTPase
VVVNDFGDVNIDAALIRASGADTLELTNGCICCQITDDVQQTMSGLAARTDIDRVICEVSGIGDPSQLGTWRTFPGFRAGPTVACADALTTEARLADEYVEDVVRAQIAGADIVLVTKTDLASAGQVERVRARCAEIAPHARVEVMRGQGEEGEKPRADVAEVLAADGPNQAALHVSGHAPGHADVHRTATVQLPEDARVETVVRVLEEHSEALARAKGFVRDDQGRWHEVQLAGDLVSVQALPTGSAAPAQAELVLIAAGPDADRILSRAAADLSR